MGSIRRKLGRLNKKHSSAMRKAASKGKPGERYVRTAAGAARYGVPVNTPYSEIAQIKAARNGEGSKKAAPAPKASPSVKAKVDAVKSAQQRRAGRKLTAAERAKGADRISEFTGRPVDKDGVPVVAKKAPAKVHRRPESKVTKKRHLEDDIRASASVGDLGRFGKFSTDDLADYLDSKTPGIGQSKAAVQAELAIRRHRENPTPANRRAMEKAIDHAGVRGAFGFKFERQGPDAGRFAAAAAKDRKGIKKAGLTSRDPAVRARAWDEWKAEVAAWTPGSKVQGQYTNKDWDYLIAHVQQVNRAVLDEFASTLEKDDPDRAAIRSEIQRRRRAARRK